MTKATMLEKQLDSWYQDTESMRKSRSAWIEFDHTDRAHYILTKSLYHGLKYQTTYDLIESSRVKAAAKRDIQIQEYCENNEYNYEVLEQEAYDLLNEAGHNTFIMTYKIDDQEYIYVQVGYEEPGVYRSHADHILDDLGSVHAACDCSEFDFQTWDQPSVPVNYTNVKSGFYCTECKEAIDLY